MNNNPSYVGFRLGIEDGEIYFFNGKEVENCWGKVEVDDYRLFLDVTTPIRNPLRVVKFITDKIGELKKNRISLYNLLLEKL